MMFYQGITGQGPRVGPRFLSTCAVAVFVSIVSMLIAVYTYGGDRGFLDVVNAVFALPAGAGLRFPACSPNPAPDRGST